MKLYIPQLGDVITLEKDWYFTLYNEYRNDSLFNHFGIQKQPKQKSISYWNDDGVGFPTTKVMLSAGTRLKVDRVFIRKGAESYSSITFVAIDLPKARAARQMVTPRFWVKLEDANTMEIIET